MVLWDKRRHVVMYNLSLEDTIIYSIPGDTRIVFDTRYLHCKCRSYKLRLLYIFGSLGIENSIDELIVIGIDIQV